MLLNVNASTWRIGDPHRGSWFLTILVSLCNVMIMGDNCSVQGDIGGGEGRFEGSAEEERNEVERRAAGGCVP